MKLAWLLLVAGCSGTSGARAWMEVRESVLGGVYPHRRSVAFHVVRIGRSTGDVTEGRYRYLGDAGVAQFEVTASVRGLGVAALDNPTQLTNAAGALLFVLEHDPTPIVRADACLALGRIVEGQALPPEQVTAGDARADAAINMTARKLRRFQKRIEDGTPVDEAEIVRVLRALANQTPSSFLSARRAMQAIGSRPVAGAKGLVLEEATRLVPGIVRRCVLVTLGSVATGGPDAEPDISPVVRMDATMALTRLGSPVAREGAIRRLGHSLDPAERNADVRRILLRYLERVPSPRAFDACVRCLEDMDSGVRYNAQLVLSTMTGAGCDSPASWHAWRDAHADWLETSDTLRGDRTPPAQSR